jgi:DnaK suppressor protein
MKEINRRTQMSAEDSMSPSTEELGERFAPLLRQELAEIEALIRDNAENTAPVALDQQSVGRLARMDAMQVQAMAQDTARRRHVRKLRIQQALRRIEEGEFGYCAECGEPIGEGRLKADPTNHECVRCATLQQAGRKR